MSVSKKMIGVGVAALVATVTACGSGGASGSAAASAAGGSAGASGPVNYGVLSCFTGRLASLGQAMLQGTQSAERAINAAGGVNGQKATMSQADTACDLADAVPATQQLLSHHIDGVVGPTTQEINAVEPILRNSHILDEFQGGDPGRDHQSDPYLFRDSPSDSQLGVAMALYAHQKGYTRAALLFYTDAAAQTLLAPIQKTFTKLGGTIVTTVNVAPGQTSYLPQVQKVIDAQPQVIFTQTDAPTAAVLFRNFQQSDNLAIPFVGTDITGGSDYLKAVGYSVAHSHLVSVYGTSLTGPANSEFLKLFGEVYPGQQPLANANYAYDAVVSMALAADYAKTTNGTTVAKDMTQVTNPPGTACFTYSTCLTLLKGGKKINYEGASGSLDYNSYNNTFGPYGAFVVDSTGAEQQVGLLSSAALAAATP